MSPYQSLWFVVTLVLVHSVQGKEKCDYEEEKCLTRAAQKTFKSLSAGIKDLIEPIDPLYIEKIAGDLGDLKYQLSNIFLTGLKDCDVVLLKCDTKKRTYECHLQCPLLVLDYFYEVKGNFASMYLDGRGLATVTIDDYLLIMTGDYNEFISEKDQMSHLTANHHNLETNLKGRFKFESKYQVNGDKAKSDVFKAYMNDNYKEIEAIFKVKFIEKFMILLLKTINTYLSHFSAEELTSIN